MRELIRAANCGHWIGLSTAERKSVALAVTRELLFNPQTSKTTAIVITVTWTVTAAYIDYDVWVIAHKHSEPTNGKAGLINDNIYTAHFDTNGRLAELQEQQSATERTCVIM